MLNNNDAKDGKNGHTNSSTIMIPELKIGDEFLKILSDNAFNGMDGGDVIEHIAKVLEITEWIKSKNPYELFNGRTPAIGFLKPFGCHVMILNTLDNLGKFEAKGDEGYFIGYSMSSKAFRVFNKRTKKVEENLHVEFLENKGIEQGAGPNWLFDIDSLTKSMNYVPVNAGTNSTNLSGTKDAVNQEPYEESSTQVPKGSGNPNPTASSSNPPADQMETLTVESTIPTVSSPVPTACLNDSPESSSEARLISKRVANQEETPSLDNILSPINRFEDILGVSTSSAETIRVEADVSNMETSISASPTPTPRIHKDHPKSQIIGPVDTLIQTRHKSKMVEEQSFIATIHQKIDPALLQLKKDVSSLRYIALPNWVHDALLESSSSKPQDGCSPEVPKGCGNTNPTASTSNPRAIQMETLTVEIPIPTVSSPVPTACLNDSPEPSSDARLISKRVANKKETPSLDNILSLTNRVEADVSNMETTILANPTPTLRIHKDHPKRHTQEERIDYDEVFVPVARIEAIRLFLAYASFMGFTMYQMDVKSAFLYGTIDEEVYVMQPPGFQDPVFPAKVYKVEKAMYGLHQAPRAWYGTLSKYSLMNGFQKGTIDQTLFIRRQREDVILVQVYGKDGTGKDVDLHIYRSTIGSLMYLTASKPDIMFAVYACARHQVTPKECHLHAVKRIFRYLQGHPKLGLWYPKALPFDLVAYSDSNYGGASQDHKSTTRGTASYCGQVLWIQNQLFDYGLSMSCEALSKEISISILC
nr:hypothetical protein [Tanacetum cinerariifolium]